MPTAVDPLLWFKFGTMQSHFFTRLEVLETVYHLQPSF